MKNKGNKRLERINLLTILKLKTMRIKSILLAVLIAVGFMACNNEDVLLVEGAESTVSLRVVPSSKGAALKAVGDISGDGILPAGLLAESEINQLEVFIFHDQAPDGYKSVTGTNVTEVTGVSTHSGLKSIFVVANAGIGAVASKNDLELKTKDLPNISAGLVMTSEETAVTLAAGQNYFGYAAGQIPTGAEHSVGSPMKITRVNARVAIIDAQLGDLSTEQLAIFDGLTDVEVAMFNVPKSTNLFGAPLAKNENFLFGEAWPTTQSSYMELADGGAAEGTFKDGGLALPITSNSAPYYYVNENNSGVAKQQMLIVLRAKPTKGGAAVVADGLYTDSNGFTYYPVWVNGSDQSYSYAGDNTGDAVIRRNTQYNIKLLIKGIGNPTIDDVEKAFLDVLVEVEPWAVVTQSLTWN